MKTRTMKVVLGLCLALSTSVMACAQLNPNTEGHIKAALEARKEAFKACYESALERDRETKGTVGLKLDLAKDTGSVTSAAVAKSDIQDTAMNQCVATTASDITLPEPPGVPVEGHYDIQFAFE
ncbi:MAG: AgmX/PglI C-terminal domain-containing protein [Myxococcota bacterium]|nr:AgmX/PglI C-terminal domain-containing protein [Myxococcota bacterium]